MKDMTSGSIVKTISLFALPNYIGNLLQQLYVFVDSIVVGQCIGTAALAAIGVCQPISYLLNACFIGVSAGFSIYIARLKGARNEAQYATAIGSFILSTLTAAVLLSALGIIFARPILQILNVPKDLLEDSVTFLQYILLTLLPSFCMIALGGSLRGFGDSKSPLVFFILGSGLNIIFEYVIVALLHGGLKGAALGTVFSQTLALMCSLVYVKCRYRIKFEMLKKLRFSRKMFFNAMQLGLPLSVQHIFLSIGIMILVSIISPLGTIVIAAFTIVGRLEVFTSMPFIDLSGALTTFIGQNIGAKQYDRIIQALKKMVFMIIGITVIVSSFLLLSPGTIAHIFSKDARVINITIEYIYITYPCLILYSIMVIMHGALNGIGKTVIPLICTILSFLVIRLPFSYFIRDIYGTTGLIWAVVVGWLAGMIYTTVMTFRYFHKNQIAILASKFT